MCNTDVCIGLGKWVQEDVGAVNQAGVFTDISIHSPILPLPWSPNSGMAFSPDPHLMEQGLCLVPQSVPRHIVLLDACLIKEEWAGTFFLDS